MKILAYTSPARGHLFPLVPILDELRSRGHEIALRTLGSEVDAMCARGFEAAKVDVAIEEIGHDDYRARSPQGALKRALRTFAERAEHDGPDLRRAIDAVEPDALLLDINTWGAHAVAELSRLPWATWCPYPIPIPSRDAPPYGPGLAPAAGFGGRVRDSLLRPVLMRTYARAILPPLNDVRTRLGARPLKDPDEFFGQMPLILYMTAEPLEYHRSDWPANVVMVGPCAWEPPADPPGWLDELNRPIVLVTTSSEFQDDGRLVRCALEGLAGEEVDIVATVPAQDPGDFSGPGNARVERFVPHGPILDRAACAVTHGGMGATQKALERGVPVCAVPFGRDQLEVARRVEAAGAGSRLPAKRLRPDRLRAKVREAMDRAAGAQRIAAAFEAAGGGRAAAEAVESRLLAAAVQPTAS